MVVRGSIYHGNKDKNTFYQKFVSAPKVRSCRNYNWNHFFCLRFVFNTVNFQVPHKKKSLPPKVPILTQNLDLTEVPSLSGFWKMAQAPFPHWDEIHYQEWITVIFHLNIKRSMSIWLWSQNEKISVNAPYSIYSFQYINVTQKTKVWSSQQVKTS